MAVMPAFVGNAGIPRVIAQGVIFRDRQGVHIRSERDLLTGISPLFKRVKPVASASSSVSVVTKPVPAVNTCVSKPVPSVNNPEMSVISQKLLNPLSRFPLLHG